MSSAIGLSSPTRNQASIPLEQSAYSGVQDFSKFDSAELSGYVEAVGSSSFRASVKLSIVKNGAGTYEVAASDIAGDDVSGAPLVSFQMTGSLLEAKIDDGVASFSSAVIKFALISPPNSAGSLDIAAENVVSGTIDSARLPLATASSAGISLGQSPNVVDFTQYLNASSGFGSTISRLSGISFKKDDGNYIAIAQITWPHSASYTTQRRGVTGITLISVSGVISSNSNKTAYVNLSSSSFYLQSNSVGDGDKVGTIIFEYSIP